MRKGSFITQESLDGRLSSTGLHNCQSTWMLESLFAFTQAVLQGTSIPRWHVRCSSRRRLASRIPETEPFSFRIPLQDSLECSCGRKPVTADPQTMSSMTNMAGHTVRMASSSEFPERTSSYAMSPSPRLLMPLKLPVQTSASSRSD